MSNRPVAPKPAAPAPQSSKRAKIIVTVDKAKYEFGILTLSGVAKNVGDKAAFGPTIKVEVYDNSGLTLLGDDHVWPAGQMLSKMAPGVQAAWESAVFVRGKPDRMARWGAHPPFPKRQARLWTGCFFGSFAMRASASADLA